ncbi:MAG TPA: hypothetical protein VFF41_05485 [Gallionella sp.]|nr:hypothetical protein [Gallionella sp.]
MVIHLSGPFYMKLASHLWKSRHGIFYFRITHQGHDFFRTTLIGCLKKNNVDSEYRHAYVGHEHGIIRDEHDRSYGDRTVFSPEEIVRSIFSGIDYEKSREFMMPKQPPHTSRRLDKYLKSAIGRPNAHSASAI